MIIPLTSLDDSRLDVFLRLTEVQLRNRLEPEKGVFIAESEKVIMRALAAGYQPISLLMPDHRVDKSQKLIELLEEYSRTANEGIPLFTAPAKEIEKLTGFELTRGVLCAMKRTPLVSVQDLLATCTKDKQRIAVLEDVTNHTNIGALFRSAAALNVDAIILTQGCCDPLYRRAIRVSMGTVFQVPWTRVEQPTSELLQNLATLGFSSAALALSDNSISLDDPILKEQPKLALLFGTEGSGLRKSTLEACVYVVRIPMAHGVDSLNVAAASAVTFWELCRS